MPSLFEFCGIRATSHVSTMSSRKRGGKTNKQPADEPQQEAEAETLVNTNAEARKLRKLRKKGLLDQPVNEEPVQPDQEAVASQINQEKMASAVSGIDQKAIAAADTNSKDVQVLGFDMKYKDQNLLEGADLKILHGRRYGIIGPNGAGMYLPSLFTLFLLLPSFFFSLPPSLLLSLSFVSSLSSVTARLGLALSFPLPSLSSSLSSLSFELLRRRFFVLWVQFFSYPFAEGFGISSFLLAHCVVLVVLRFDEDL